MKKKILCAALSGVVLTGPLVTGSRATDPPPEVAGDWGPVLNWWPVQAAAMVVLKTGKILVVDDWSPEGDDVMLFDPSDESTCLIAQTTLFVGDSIFCAGHAQLANGKIVFVGGGRWEVNGHPLTWIFDPDAADCGADPWSDADDMPTGER